MKRHGGSLTATPISTVDMMDTVDTVTADLGDTVDIPAAPVIPVAVTVAGAMDTAAIEWAWIRGRAIKGR